MKYLFILLASTLLFSSNSLACTDEEYNKISWLRAQEAQKLRLEKTINDYNEKHTELSSDIQKVKGGEWPLVKVEKEVSDEVSDSDGIVS